MLGEELTEDLSCHLTPETRHRGVHISVTLDTRYHHLSLSYHSSFVIIIITGHKMTSFIIQTQPQRNVQSQRRSEHHCITSIKNYSRNTAIPIWFYIFEDIQKLKSPIYIGQCHNCWVQNWFVSLTYQATLRYWCRWHS